MNDTVILLLFTFAFGTIIGAYYGTIEYRVRNDAPLFTKDCYCPSCRHILPLKYQIPIISWIMLKGKCKFCNSKISPIYPLVESGFAVYYTILFVFLHNHPILMTAIWIVTIAAVLLTRCNGNYKTAFIGIRRFSIFNIIYGSLLTIITVATL